MRSSVWSKGSNSLHLANLSRENLHRLATGGYPFHPLPVAIRCQAVDGAGENLHRLATGGYRLPVAIRCQVGFDCSLVTH